MKTTFCLLLALATLTSARAEIFRSGQSHAARRDGDVSAHRTSGHRDNDHRDYGRRDYGRHDYGRDHHRTHVSVGIGYGRNYSFYGGPGYYGHGYGYGYYTPYRAWPSYSYYPGYGADYPYYGSYGYGNGSYATNGLLLGALAGGIIGHNSGDFRHNGWRGAAWGAGLGWLLGAVADSNRRPVVYQTAPVVAQPAALMQAPAQPAVPTQAQQPQQLTIINNYFYSPMSGANTLFGR
jgi:hypothetical protein